MKRIGTSLTLTLALVACGNAPLEPGDDATPSDGGADVTSDVATDTTTDLGADGGPTCQDDIYGVTSEERSISVSEAASLGGLTACAGVPDYFAFTTLPTATAAIVRIEADGEISFTVDGVQATGTEHVAERELEDDSPVLVVVTAAADTGYGIEFVSQTDELQDCLRTEEEPNEGLEDAFEVTEDSFSLETRLCEADNDWFAFDVPAGGVLEVSIDFVHDEGDLDTALYDAADSSSPIEESNGGQDGESVSVGPIATEGRYYFHVYGWEGAENSYTLRSEISVEGEGFTAEVSGTVEYEDRVFSPSGFTGELVPKPAQNTLVEIVRDDGAVVGTGFTDEAGAFALQYFAQDGESYSARAVSVGSVDGFRVEVRDRTGASALYAVESEPFDAAPEVSGISLLAAADDGIGGGLNIVDETNRGFRFVARYSDHRSPTLTYFWQGGQSYSCGSCYSDNSIRLGGQLEDPDEYDDDIILHEFSHYMVAHYSADSSPGGSHRDRLVDPYLAYGEGLAYFLSSAIREDPTMTDNFLGEARFIDYEAVTLAGEDLDDFYGTTNGRLDGNQREEMPAGIIWDVWDGPNPDEPWDTIELGDRTIEILFEYFSDGMPVDVGVRGIEISDFINAIACELEVSTDLQPVVDDREYPFDVEEDAECEFKGHEQSLWVHEEQGQLWLHGDTLGRRFQIEVASADSVEKREVLCSSAPCVIHQGANSDEVVLAVGGQGAGAASWVGADALLRMLGGRLSVEEGRAVRAYPTR